MMPTRRLLLLVLLTLATWAWILAQPTQWTISPSHVVTPEQWGRVG